MVCHRSTRCARRRARRPVHSTRAPPPRTAPAAKHISSQARDRIAPLTLTWRSSSLYAQLNGRNSRKMPKKSKNRTGAARDALAANKRARRAADEPHTADTPSPCEQLIARLNDASVRCAIDDVNVPSSSAGQPAPVEVLQTLLAASDRAADARHPRDAKHGHESRTEHLEVATRFSSGLIFRLIRLHTVTKKCVHTAVGRVVEVAGSRLSVYC